MKEIQIESVRAMKGKQSAGKIVRLWQLFLKEKYLWLLALPGLIYFIIYKYIPMLGIVIAFQKYVPTKGFLGSDWVGLDNFIQIFDSSEIGRYFMNTLIISFYQIVFAFTIPIVIAIMLNELRVVAFQRVVQTLIYLPHFLSWVVVAGIFYLLFQSDGSINHLLQSWGMEPINLLSNKSNFREMLVMQVIWKEAGWGTIIYLAALTGIDPELYEAAKIDGAGRFRQIWHITLPGIRSTIIILFILRLGHVLDVGFEQVYLMLNSSVSEVGEIIDSYVYRVGVVNGNFSFTTAVGLLKGVVGMILIVGANYLSRRAGEKGVY
ncbi:ABC transporter permease [Paenibacillus roseipurpureus]|uniref:ABC transporter permease subunit n=1 Tax=Paenibacillus roseopurpureus TaxID=2918901 RepID=A0AA96RNX2_9BACL|nr:ABC transporter permease subunit [Paenibacillus sp. MBLB1832]WNR45997.1 ABC transporter permease subunit [Paenibacillus sp. MBLB1832]